MKELEEESEEFYLTISHHHIRKGDFTKNKSHVNDFSDCKRRDVIIMCSMQLL